MTEKVVVRMGRPTATVASESLTSHRSSVVPLSDAASVAIAHARAVGRARGGLGRCDGGRVGGRMNCSLGGQHREEGQCEQRKGENASGHRERKNSARSPVVGESMTVTLG